MGLKNGQIYVPQVYILLYFSHVCFCATKTVVLEQRLMRGLNEPGTIATGYHCLIGYQIRLVWMLGPVSMIAGMLVHFFPLFWYLDESCIRKEINFGCCETICPAQ